MEASRQLGLKDKGTAVLWEGWAYTEAWTQQAGETRWAWSQPLGVSLGKLAGAAENVNVHHGHRSEIPDVPIGFQQAPW